MKRDFNESSIADLYVLYLLLIYGFNRMLRFNKNGDFNLPVGNVDFNANVVNALEAYFMQVISKNLNGLISIIKISYKNKVV